MALINQTKVQISHFEYIYKIAGAIKYGRCSGSTTKITINNRRLNRLDFEEQILIGMKDDGLNELREEYNDMLLDKATGSNAIIQDKYVTISVNRKSITRN